LHHKPLTALSLDAPHSATPLVQLLTASSQRSQPLAVLISPYLYHKLFYLNTIAKSFPVYASPPINRLRTSRVRLERILIPNIAFFFFYSETLDSFDTLFSVGVGFSALVLFPRLGFSCLAQPSSGAACPPPTQPPLVRLI
jgi:hypothetical protein